jgi:hypothetical protein
LLDPAHATLDDIDVAFTAEKGLLPAWIRVVGHAADLDLRAVAGQAMAVLASWRSGDPDVMDRYLRRHHHPHLCATSAGSAPTKLRS